MAIISADRKNNEETWWSAARGAELPDLPPIDRAALVALVHGLAAQISVVNIESLIAIAEWAASLPGWDDGPDDAARALLIGDAGPDAETRT